MPFILDRGSIILVYKADAREYQKQQINNSGNKSFKHTIPLSEKQKTAIVKINYNCQRTIRKLQKNRNSDGQ